MFGAPVFFLGGDALGYYYYYYELYDFIFLIVSFFFVVLDKGWIHVMIFIS